VDPKPIEPDTSLGGIVGRLARPLKTRKGDRMAVFTLEDGGRAGVEVIAFHRHLPAERGASSKTGTLVLVSRKARTGRGVDPAPGVGDPCRLDSLRERLGGAKVAIRVKMPADRGVFEALGAGLFSRHPRPIAASRSKSKYPRGRSHCACARGCIQPDPRCVPSPTLIRRGGGDRGAHGSGFAEMRCRQDRMG